MSGGCGYTLAIMNDAIKPGPETPSQAGLPELSVVVPTFNERDNVTVLYRRLEATLSGIAWEVVFVDDNSPDGTWEVVRGLARKDSRVRCIRRIGRRGLSGACIEGILASSGPYAAVIDADLQHDETQLPKMVALLRSGEAELVVGSRYIEGGSADSFNKQRAGASQLATEVARRALKVEVADPMSGFFMIRRDRFEQLAPQLSTQGFKILLDVIATAQGKLRTVEIPYTFGSRQHGESKLDSMVALDFLGLVLAKLTHDVVSLRFLLFAMVGGTGLVVHLAALFIAHEIFQEPFAEAQARRRADRHDQQFHPEQFSHLSRPAAEGICDPARPVAVLSRLRRRTARQCRRRVRGLRPGTDLVARRACRRADGRGLELRDVRTVRLAQAMMDSVFERSGYRFA